MCRSKESRAITALRIIALRAHFKAPKKQPLLLLVITIAPVERR